MASCGSLFLVGEGQDVMESWAKLTNQSPSPQPLQSSCFRASRLFSFDVMAEEATAAALEGIELLDSSLADGLAWGVPCLASPRAAVIPTTTTTGFTVVEQEPVKLSTRVQFRGPSIDLSSSGTTPPQLSPADSEFGGSGGDKSETLGMMEGGNSVRMSTRKHTMNVKPHMYADGAEDDDVDEDDDEEAEEEDDDDDDADEGDDSEHDARRRRRRNQGRRQAVNRAKRVKASSSGNNTAGDADFPGPATTASGNNGKIRICKKCSKSYTSREGLRLHIRNVHLDDKKHVCHQCQVRFVRGGDLKLHFLRVHCPTAERPFPCHQGNCEKAFASKSELTRHLKTHD